MRDYYDDGGIGFCGLLALIFITLKLMNYISWSWWWVLSPLWMPAAIVFVLAFIIVLFLKIGSLIEK